MDDSKSLDIKRADIDLESMAIDTARIDLFRRLCIWRVDSTSTGPAYRKLTVEILLFEYRYNECDR
jgi:hypothetical protein